MAPPRKSARGKISSSNDLLSDAGTTPAKASKSRALAQPRKANSPRGQAGKKRSIADHRNNEEADSESVIDPTTQASSPKRARRAKDSVGSVSPPRPPEERRLRRFRDHPPKSYQERLEQLRTATYSTNDLVQLIIPVIYELTLTCDVKGVDLRCTCSWDWRSSWVHIWCDWVPGRSVQTNHQTTAAVQLPRWTAGQSVQAHLLWWVTQPSHTLSLTYSLWLYPYLHHYDYSHSYFSY